MSESPLSRLRPPKGAVQKRKRLGRGVGSGLGRTCGRGNKGQRARAGRGPHPRFEGGQMPLQRRMPKRGFYNPFRKEYATINVRDLERFEAGTVVDMEALRRQGLIPKKMQDGVKVLGEGELKKALTVRAHRFSESARQKIEAVGGTIEVIEGAK